MSALVQSLENRNHFNAGGLDGTYGTNGLGSVTLPANTQVNVSALQSGDRMLLGGGTKGANTNSFVTPYLVRFTAEGKVDTNFAGTSLVAGNVRSLNSIAAIATLPTGQILIAGNYGGLASATEILRLKPSGKLDTTFGKHGVAKASFATTQMTVGSDGKIVLGGLSSDDLNSNIHVARFNSDGTPDTNFGSGGTAQLSLNLPGKSDPDIPSIYRTSVQFLSETSDGRVVIAGTHSFNGGGSSENATDNPYIARLSSNGNLDPKFGNNGRMHLQQIEGAQEAFAITDDGDFLVAGGGAPIVGMGDKFTPQVLYKIRANNTSDTSPSLDQNFGTKGSITLTDGTTNDGASHLLVQSDGKIVTDGGFQLTRYNADGSIDSSFSAPKQTALDSYNLVGVGSDGSIFTTGIEALMKGSDTIGFAERPVRYWREEGPAGLLNASDIAASTSSPYRFSIQWRDDDGVNLKSLVGTYIRVTAPDGQTYKAHFLGTTKTGNGIMRTANYKLAAPGGSWNASDIGTYTIRLLGGAVKDINGATASKRTLGVFYVQIG